MAGDFHQSTWDTATEADCRRIIREAVLEDLDRGYDWTTVALVPPEAKAKAAVVARRDGIIAGLPAAALVADEMDRELRFTAQTTDGSAVTASQTVAMLEGPARSVLAAERLVLNLLGKLSGIASLTEQYVNRIAGTKARIYDTRKTTPAWRRLEKYAVRQGGGHNHRTGLFDAILIKDNHLAFLERQVAAAAHGSDVAEATTLAPAARAVRMARDFLIRAFPLERSCQLLIEVEVDSLAQLEAALAERPDIVLLDNMTAEQLKAAVELRNGLAAEVELEASGGVTLDTVAQIAQSGVDRISVGALTHSAPSFDVGLDWIDSP
jgi:nicotinate-nucleotide pyrophosphorylase (carboxylating)